MDKFDQSRVGAVALNTVFGYEPKFSHQIIDSLGSPEAVFTMPRSRLAEILGPYSRYLDKTGPGALEKARREMERLEAEGYRIVTCLDDCYPELLRECPDAPVALYVRSSSEPSEIFGSRPLISIVGTRDQSLYGKEWCEKLVGALSRAPVRPAIVSGLALGVDITAHMAALGYGLPTIGVSPVGIDAVYPRRHSVAAAKISGSPGSAIITDYPPGTTPLAVNFLRRNRIIAGISSATILIESKVRGGGMLTARLAAGYGRDVLALPGRIDDLRSAGCNLLIRQNVAEPVISPETLAESLGLGRSAGARRRPVGEELAQHFAGMLPEEELERLRAVMEAVGEHRGITIEELCTQLETGFPEAARYTGLLESEGFITIDVLQRCTINCKFY